MNDSRVKNSVKGNFGLATPQFLAVGKESRCSRPFQAQARRVLYSSSQGHSSFIGPGGMPRSQARREIQGKSPAPARRIGTSAPFCGKKANPLSADPIQPMLMSITPFWPSPTIAFLKTGRWQSISFQSFKNSKPLEFLMDYAFSSLTLAPEGTFLKTLASPETLPITLTALAGRTSLPRLIGVGPKKIQKALPVGQ